MADAFPPAVHPTILSISHSVFIGAGGPTAQSFDIVTSRAAAGAAAVLLLDGVEVAGALTTEVLTPLEPGKTGVLRVTILTETLAAGPYTVVLRDANGDSPGVQVLVAMA